MQFLDRYVNARLEAICLLAALAIGIFVGWHYALTFTLTILLAGAILKIARTDRGVTALWDAVPAHRQVYRYPGTDAEGRYPRMANLTIRSISGQPFTVLIGVEFNMPRLGIKFHPFGRVRSNAHGVAITRTWLGRSPVTFMYLTSIPSSDIDVVYHEGDQNTQPDVTNWPHLVQLFL